MKDSILRFRTLAIILASVLLLANDCYAQKIARIDEIYISGIQTDLNASHGLFLNPQGSRFAYIIKGSLLLIHNVSSDSTILAYNLPIVSKFHAIDFFDENTFVFWADNVFYLMDSTGNFTKVYQSEFGKDLIFLPYGGLKYYHNLGLIVAAAVEKNNKVLDGKKILESRFLCSLSLKTKKHHFFGPQYPKMYHGGNLGTPRFFISRDSTFLVLSLEYDKYIYVIDMGNCSLFARQKVSTKKQLTTKFENSISSSKKDKKDIYNANALYSARMGMAFWDVRRSEFFFVYYPEMAIKDNDRYYNLKDKEIRIVRMGSSKKAFADVTLNAGVFFVPYKWHFNHSTSTMSYIKMYKSNLNDELWSFKVIDIRILN